MLSESQKCKLLKNLKTEFPKEGWKNNELLFFQLAYYSCVRFLPDNYSSYIYRNYYPPQVYENGKTTRIEEPAIAFALSLPDIPKWIKADIARLQTYEYSCSTFENCYKNISYHKRMREVIFQ